MHKSISLRAAQASDLSPQRVFASSLVTGASVSANWNTLSPGERLSRRYGGPNNVLTIAQGGAPGREMIQRLSPTIVSTRSAIIAIDFLFWDSTLNSATESLEALQKLQQLASTAGVPLILGDIPELLPGRQPLRDTLNAAINEACTPWRGCFKVPLEQLHLKAQREGLEIEGRRYTLPELVPDGLHLSEPASEFLANQILEVLK